MNFRHRAGCLKGQVSLFEHFPLKKNLQRISAGLYAIGGGGGGGGGS